MYVCMHIYIYIYILLYIYIYIYIYVFNILIPPLRTVRILAETCSKQASRDNFRASRLQRHFGSKSRVPRSTPRPPLRTVRIAYTGGRPRGADLGARICIYIYIYAYIYIYIYIHTHTYIYIYIYIYMYIYIYIYIHPIQIHIHTYTYMYTNNDNKHISPAECSLAGFR